MNEVFNVSYQIQVDLILPDKNGFSYHVITKNNFYQRTDYYFSTNLRAIQRQRERLITKYKKLNLDPDLSNSWHGHTIKPTLIDRLFPKSR